MVRKQFDVSFRELSGYVHSIKGSMCEVNVPNSAGA